jgi:protein O-GlcNAc transferase
MFWCDTPVSATSAQPMTISAPLSQLVERGVSFHRQGRLPEAARIYAEVLRTDPNQFEALHPLGVIMYQQGQLLAALQLLEAALRQSPNSPDGLSNYGLVLRSLARPAEALQAFDKAVMVNPAHPEMLVNRGNLLNELERHAEALQSFDDALKVRPNYGSALVGRGAALFKLDRLAESLASLDRALAVDPKDVDALAQRANPLCELNRFEEALAACNAAIADKPQTPISHYNRAKALRGLGRDSEAAASYKHATAIEIDALFQRGCWMQNAQCNEAALASYDRLLALKPDHVEALINRGNALQSLNRYEEALAAYGKALEIKPGSTETLNNRGTALQALGCPADALASYDKALAIKPDFVEVLHNRGNALQALDRLNEALASYDRVIALKPNYAPVYDRRGNALLALKRRTEALASYDRAIVLNPDFVEAYNNRGNALLELKRPDEALASYDRAIRLRPHDAELYRNRGNALLELKRSEEALASYDRAIALKADFIEAHNNRGKALLDLKRPEEALTSYDRTIALKPDLAEAWVGRGNAFLQLNLNDKAIENFEKACATRPDFAGARFAACMAELPVLYASEDDIAHRRAAYEQKLKALHADVNACKLRGDWDTAIGSKQPFYLAYQGYNDRALQTIYGSLVCGVMEREYPPAKLPARPTDGEPVRVGIVSSFFWQHSNWKAPIKGWISQLDRRRFKLFGYHIGTKRDAETEFAATICDRFVHRLTGLEGWRQEILADAPHVLIYPGLLMDALSVQLAAQRLAPVQCNSWGHPETSGMPTLDYFLSSDLMEPPDAAEHYSEQLIRLPNLSIYYEPYASEPGAMRREDLGLRPDAVVFWCGQSLYKYLPQFDGVFAHIAAQANHCQFVFVQHHEGQQVTTQFQQRLERAFEAAGVKSADYCVMLPRLKQDQFFAALGQCDVFLDSLGWSGCNSTLESLEHNLPIVTLQGALMRGRHSATILRMMGVVDTIAETIDDFVAIAVRLANHPEFRRALSRRIADGKHRVYRDRDCIAALEEFLDRAARQQA